MLVGSGKQRPGVQSLPDLRDNGGCGDKNSTILTRSVENLRSAESQKALKFRLSRRLRRSPTPIFCHRCIPSLLIVVLSRVTATTGTKYVFVETTGSCGPFLESNLSPQKSFRVAVFIAKVVFFLKTYYILRYQFPWKRSFLDK